MQEIPNYYDDLEHDKDWYVLEKKINGGVKAPVDAVAVPVAATD